MDGRSKAVSKPHRPRERKRGVFGLSAPGVVGAWGAFPILIFPVSPSPLPASLSLAGPWRICLDPVHPETSPPPDRAFAAEITLPATTETAGLGPLNPDHRADRLTAVRRIEGPVWYQREFTVPVDWRERFVTLFLERTKWCRVWLDGRPIGENPLLCTPHEHQLDRLAPGPHRLTLLVDNRRRPAPGDNHQISEHTQGNWNGVLGTLGLRATGALWIEHIAVVPDVATRTLHVTVQLGRAAGTPFAGTIRVTAGTASTQQPAGERVSLHLPLGPAAALWDEFSPGLHRVNVTLATPHGGDERELTTGLREFRRAGTQFAINGRGTFLRGEVNCCVFPLTGHPPMDVAGWRDYFAVLRAHGLNHVRFHSWTPPDAAFTAADELGFYVLAELPFWGEWKPAIAAALAPEGEAILRTYGHHPSFVLLTLGNEHRGDRAARAGLVERLRALDPSRLYAQGANNDLATPSLAPGDDCWITARLPAGGRFVNVRGAHATPDRADGHLQTGPGGTCTDYRDALAGLALPVISHEIGQYSTYPRYAEIDRYTGVFAAHNLGLFRERARIQGVLDRADRFAAASAALAALCYREEIEAALRTPGFGGFELLGLQDFPGQGTALVGLLDAFLASKEAITPVAFRTFCGPHVLLARFPRHTWSAGESFSADLELAHHGPADVPAGELRWMLGEAGGPLLVHGSLATPARPRGGLRTLGRLDCVLPMLPAARRLELTLAHPPSGTLTTYPLWVYPATEPAAPAGVMLVRAWDAPAQQALADGGTVVLCADATRPFPGTPGGGFTPDFWCWSMFKNVPGTLGLAIAPEHPALADFPTETHSNWQWFHLARAAQPVVLDGLPTGLTPIIEVIDNPTRAHRLGLLFEVRVGPGRLLVCGIDLPALAARHPEARALLAGLLRYAASPGFAPSAAVTAGALAPILQP